MEEMVAELGMEIDGFSRQPVHGRIYPAVTVAYRKGRGLVQTGTSPGYWGDVWSLTCCKHDMREEKFYDYFEETEPGVFKPTEPLIVFTTSGKSKSESPDWAQTSRRWVASVALVTHAFRGMEDYGRFLMEQDEKAWGPRMSTYTEAEGSDWAKKYGDCHAIIEDGGIAGDGSPFPEHDHVSGSGTTSCGCTTEVDPDSYHVYQEDNDRSYLKFASTPKYWISWSEPDFYWNGKGRSRYGGGRPAQAYDPTGKSSNGTILSDLREVY